MPCDKLENCPALLGFYKITLSAETKAKYCHSFDLDAGSRCPLYPTVEEAGKAIAIGHVESDLVKKVEEKISSFQL